MAHKFDFFEAGQFDHYARCRCGYVTGRLKTKQLVDDEVAKHLRNMERIALHLGNRNVSTAAAHAYYRAMADNPEVAPEDRTQWRMLAEELAPRVRDKNDRSADIELPFG